MDLNDIHFPMPLLEALYKKSLVAPAGNAMPVAVPVPGAAASGDIRYLGKNGKGVCVLVNYPNEVYLPDADLHFLTTILQACRLDLGDVAIVNHYQYPLSFTALEQALSCNVLLILGLSPTLLGLKETDMFIISGAGACRQLAAPAIALLHSGNAESKSLKSRLWSCLKELFDI